MSDKKKLYINIGIKVLLVVILVFLAFPSINPLLSYDTKATLVNEYKTHLGLITDGSTAGFSLEKMLCAVAVFILLYLLTTLVSFIIEKVCSHQKRSQTVAGLIISIVKTVCYIAYVVWFLSLLGVNLVAIFASLGILSLIIGFGVQSLIEDCITGIFIIIEGEYNIGDIIVLDNFRGTVKKITLRTTTIQDDGGNLQIINNSDIRNIQNRSNNISYTSCEIGISYEEDLLKVEGIITKALPKMYEEHKDMFADVPTYGGVQALDAHAVILRVGVKCKEKDVFAAKRVLNREMKLLFDANNISIPYNQIVVHQSK